MKRTKRGTWTTFQLARRRQRPSAEALEYAGRFVSRYGSRLVRLNKRHAPLEVMLAMHKLLVEQGQPEALISSVTVGDNLLMILKANKTKEVRDITAVVALDLARVGTLSRPSFLDDLVDHLGEAHLVGVARELLSEGRLAHPGVVYRWLLKREGAADSGFHLDAMRSRTAELRDLAVVTVGRTPAAREALEAMLGDEAARCRLSAARALGLGRHAESMGALGEALEREEDAMVRRELERALHACDPSFVGPPLGEQVHFGAYPLRAPVDGALLMNELREILHDHRQTTTSWMRLCDVMQRFGDRASRGMALDYLEFFGVEEAWTAGQRLRPLTFEAHPRLKRLCGNLAMDFVPISAIASGAAERIALTDVVHKDKIVIDEAARAQFLEGVQQGWALCETQGIPPEHLNIEYHLDTSDPGWALVLRLYRAFGVGLSFQRRATRRPQPSHSFSERTVTVPKAHPRRRVLVAAEGSEKVSF